ncbi:MAG: hypothetical protein ABWZ26_05825 [Candidatus Nanopelagicales bacterium]
MTLDVYSGLFDDDLDDVARRLDRDLGTARREANCSRNCSPTSAGYMISVDE